MGWAGYISPSVLDTVEFEYFAIRNQTTLFDISPMHKYRLRGPDAEAVLNRMVTRDVRKIRTGRVGYAIWCDEEGMAIDDGTLFRFGKNDFRLCCQERMLGWVQDAAWGFNVTIEDESQTVVGLALQGPTSFSLLSDAGLGKVAKLRPFDMRAGRAGSVGPAPASPAIWATSSGSTGIRCWVSGTGCGRPRPTGACAPSATRRSTSPASKPGLSPQASTSNRCTPPCGWAAAGPRWSWASARWSTSVRAIRPAPAPAAGSRRSAHPSGQNRAGWFQARRWCPALPPEKEGGRPVPRHLITTVKRNVALANSRLPSASA